MCYTENTGGINPMKHTTLLLTTALLTLLLSSCATTKPQTERERQAESTETPLSSDDIPPTPILELKNITLDGTNWMKTQFRDSRTGNPIANRKFIIYVIMGDDDSDIGEIITRSDADGWVYVRNIPDGECFGDFFLHED